MSLAQWLWIYMVYIILTLLFSIGDLAFGSTEQSALNELAQFNIFEMKEFGVLFMKLSAPIPNLSYFTNIVSILFWDFPFFSGDMNAIRWILFVPLSLAMVGVIIVSIGPIFINLIATARGFIPFLR